MTRKVRIITTVVGAIVAGGVVFAIAASIGPSPSSGGDQASRPANDAPATHPGDEAHVRRWLGAEADPDYRTQVRQLNEEVRRHRKELARLLEQPELSEPLVREQFEQLMAAQNALQRRMVNHVLKIQGNLPPERRAALLRTMAHRLGERGEFERPNGGLRGIPATGTRRRTPESGPAPSGARRERERRSRPASAPASAPEASEPALP